MKSILLLQILPLLLLLLLLLLVPVVIPLLLHLDICLQITQQCFGDAVVLAIPFKPGSYQFESGSKLCLWDVFI